MTNREIHGFFSERLDIAGKSITCILGISTYGILLGSESGTIRYVELSDIGTRSSAILPITNKDSIFGLATIGSLYLCLNSMGWLCVFELTDGRVSNLLEKTQRSIPKGYAVNIKRSNLSVVYDHRQLITYSLDLETLWAIELMFDSHCLAWSPDGLLLAVGGTSSIDPIIIYGDDGRFMRQFPPCCCTGGLDELMGISWNIHGLLIAYMSGKAQVLRTVMDDDPILLDCATNILNIRWSEKGEYIAFASHRSILLFTHACIHLQTLHLSDTVEGQISNISWAPDDSCLFVAVGSVVCILRIPNLIQKSLLDAYACILYPENTLSCMLLDNTQNVPASRIQCTSVLDVRGGCDSFMTLVQVGNVYETVIYATTGSIIKRRKISLGRPIISSDFNGKICIVAHPLFCQLWHTDLDTVDTIFVRYPTQFVSGDPGPDIPETEDQITCTSISPEGTVTVARQSGLIHLYKDKSLLKNLLISTRPDRMHLNMDGSQIAIIDFKSKLLLLDSSSGDVRETHREECWDVVWAQDTPNTLACRDRNKLYVLTDGKPEEPLLLGNRDVLLGLRELEIYLTDGTEIRRIPCKALRDCRAVLHSVGDLDDGLSYVEKHPHNRLWRTLAEQALVQHPVRQDVFEAAIRRIPNEGNMIADSISGIVDPEEKRMEGLLWLGNVEEACRTVENVRQDLLARLKERVGDYDWISAQLDWQSIASADRIGDHYFFTGQYEKASDWYMRGSIWSPNLLEALLITNRYEDIIHISRVVPKDHPLVSDLVRVLFMSGLESEAQALVYRSGKPSCFSEQTTVESLMDSGRFAEVMCRIRDTRDSDILMKLVPKVSHNMGFGMKQKINVLSALMSESFSWEKVEMHHLFRVVGRMVREGNTVGACVAAERLGDFEEYMNKDEVVRLYRLQAVCGLLCGDFDRCSKAFSKLEVSEDVSESDRKKIKHLGLKLFGLKDWESRGRILHTCPKCGHGNGDSVLCTDCGWRFRYCSDNASIETSTLRCLTCSRYLSAHARDLIHCPLCHQKL